MLTNFHLSLAQFGTFTLQLKKKSYLQSHIFLARLDLACKSSARTHH